MHIDIFTLFPAMFQGPFQESILKRAMEQGLLSIAIHNIRDYATDKHHVTDDYPYGGGAGMVLKPEPIFAAVEAVLSQSAIANRQSKIENRKSEIPIILLSPQGRLFTQAVAQELAAHPRLALLCGHYEGVDERVRQHLATDEISIGDYVLTGGELPAMVIVDAVARLLPGVLDAASPLEESHASGLLEYAHYTRPPEFRGWAVPEVLLSGNHAAIARWRRQEALRRTRQRRPDLLARATLTAADKQFLQELEAEK
ncbi:MAG: tRNA (guanosine(37)-N1)-methyltransferase TrmD [Chloroflexi bacterium]|nr:tRNA (guanosine(37)-N1)-methyltransferase TrmD [Chloroflexota bacterium]